jgi:predicted HAD superfamily Cof-like phosphohydrolase
MSNDWVKDIAQMHDKFGVDEWVRANSNNKELMNKFLEFRVKFLEEELNETKLAFENNDAEEIVDGLIDLCVIAIGTLDAFGVNSYQAWCEVLNANMAKERGIKPERPNPLGLPDMMKPEGWTAPSHNGNHGQLFNALFTDSVQ